MCAINNMACFTPWIFRDNAGHAWALGVTTAGKLTLSQVTPIPSRAILQAPLTDTVDGHVYGVIVVYTASGPMVSTTAALAIPAIGSFIPMAANGRTFWLQTKSGRLFGSWQTSVGTSDPVVGELFNTDLVNPSVVPPNLPNAGLPTGEQGGWLPHYTQPGGIGSQSQPQQQSGSTSQITGVPYEVGMALNTSPCGHWFNNFEITFSTVSCEQAALVRCPLCGYLIEIITPASRLYSDPGLEHISS